MDQTSQTVSAKSARAYAALKKNRNPCATCQLHKQGCSGGPPCDRCVKKGKPAECKPGRVNPRLTSRSEAVSVHESWFRLEPGSIQPAPPDPTSQIIPSSTVDQVQNTSHYTRDDGMAQTWLQSTISGPYSYTTGESSPHEHQQTIQSSSFVAQDNGSTSYNCFNDTFTITDGDRRPSEISLLSGVAIFDAASDQSLFASTSGANEVADIHSYGPGQYADGTSPFLSPEEFNDESKLLLWLQSSGF